MKNLTSVSFVFRTLLRLCSGLLLALLAQHTYGEGGMPYSNVLKFSLFARAETIEGKKYLIGYLKMTDPQAAALNPEKAGFRMELSDGTVIPLRVAALEDIPTDKRTEEDTVSIEEAYTHKTWVPFDGNAYAGATIKHDLGKGAVTIIFRRNWNKDPNHSQEAASNAPDKKEALLQINGTECTCTR